MKHLLPPVTYYKASLHTHSTVSDGQLTPEEVKAAYKEKGYSILALTDHSAMVDHSELTEPDFLMITGVEMDLVKERAGKTCHLCMLSRDPHLQWIPFRDADLLPHMAEYVDRCENGELPHSYSPENINAIIAKANEKGCLVTYNHPAWSMEYYPDYSPLEGLWGMEYFNSGSAAYGHDEHNGWVFREFLHLRKNLMPVMADDMHRTVNPRSGCPVLGVACTMVGAEALTYDAVMDALARGDLYSSLGPEIHSLTWDDGILRITCSPAKKIQLIKNRRRYEMRLGEGLTEAEFDMKKWHELSADDPDGWFYLIVTAADGTYAVTRAYRSTELA